MKAWTQPADHRHASHEDLAASVCEALKSLLNPEVDGEDRGLYLVTADAGIQCAVRFWTDALAETPRFASPAGFPWTLANAPAGYIARELDLRGPNHTLVGEAEAAAAAWQHGRDDLATGRVAEAVLIRLDLDSACQAAAVVLVDATARLDLVKLDLALP